MPGLPVLGVLSRSLRDAAAADRVAADLPARCRVSGESVPAGAAAMEDPGQTGLTPESQPPSLPDLGLSIPVEIRRHNQD